MKETWKPLECGNYEVSSYGKLRRKTPGRKTWPGRPLKLVLMGMGYYVVNPVINGKNVLMYVHHVVAIAFIGDRPNGKELNHIDGNKLNNHVDNLEYVTHQENMAHAGRFGFLDRGTISNDTAETIRRMRNDGETWAEISKTTGVSRRHARDIASFKRRKDQC